MRASVIQRLGKLDFKTYYVYLFMRPGRIMIPCPCLFLMTMYSFVRARLTVKRYTDGILRLHIQNKTPKTNYDLE